MKKSFTYFFLFLIGGLVFGQQIPNGNFENWTAASNYDNPTGWDTPNSTSASLGVITVTKESSTVQNGTYATKLISKSIFGTPIPGLITLGNFNINLINFEATIEGGVPFTFKPEALIGYYQYEPVLGDEAFIGVILLKQNGSNWDTIADGSFTSTSNIMNWTPFTATLNYRSAETPTHLNIIILSSDRNAVQPNSTLYIDNLTFTYPVSVNDNTPTNTEVFYSDGMLNIVTDQPDLKIESVKFFSIDGKQL